MNIVVEDKLKDLYNLSQAESTYLWHDKLYTEVLKDKIERAKKVQDDLLSVPMMKKDSARIKRVGDSISHNYMLLKEVSNGN